MENDKDEDGRPHLGGGTGKVQENEEDKNSISND